MKLAKLTLKEASQLLKEKKISSVELTKALLFEIDEKNKGINAYITLERDLALRKAKESDQRLKAKKPRSILEGMPIAVKDNILTSGIKTTAASGILENFIAPYDATVVVKLKNAGAVILGKTNMDEFAMGSSTETSFFGPTRNPHDLKRVPGGSSGGSAAAVAADMAIAAIGSDTGGSIRQPASFCGVVGLKPTYGLVSRYGLIAMASSLDQIGPITKTVDDAGILLKVIEGWDPKDSTSIKVKSEKLKVKSLSQNLKIGILDTEPTDESKTVYRNALSKVAKSFKNIQETKELNKILDAALAAYYIIMPVEVSSNLARYDGIKYGLRAESKNLLEQYLNTRSEGFGDEAKRRIILGVFTSKAGYVKAYYNAAQQARALIQKAFDNVFQKFDLIIMPTSPILPFGLGEKIDDPLSMYLADIYTVPPNIAGLPAISIPAGRVGSLPVGLQIVGPKFSEKKILEFAKIIEKNVSQI